MGVPRVDAHQHFWRLSRGDYGWLTSDLAPLYRDFEPADLAPRLVEAGIDASVAVQAAPSVAETRFLLELADATSWIAGVVGWIDMEAADSVDSLMQLAYHPNLCGIRPMIQDIGDPAWMLGERLRPVFDALTAETLCFDALVRPEHLPNLAILLNEHPQMRVIIDHGAKPAIASGEFEAWAAAIACIASETEALCKLSGLVTEASDDWTPDSLRRYVDWLLETFGPGRLVWGSDWPVVHLASDYAGWRACSLELLEHLTDSERDAILGGNAIRFYDLDIADHATEVGR